jgi:hypothetical protein
MTPALSSISAARCGTEAIGRSSNQTDPGTNEHGIMGRTSDACKLADVRGQYAVTMSGASVPMDTGGPPTPVVANGVINADGSGTFAFDQPAQPSSSSETLRGRGTFEVDPDCIVRFDVARIAADGTSATPVKAARNPGERW